MVTTQAEKDGEEFKAILFHLYKNTGVTLDKMYAFKVAYELGYRHCKEAAERAAP